MFMSFINIQMANWSETLLTYFTTLGMNANTVAEFLENVY